MAERQYDWSREMPDKQAFNTGFWSFFNNKDSRFRANTTRDKEFTRGWNAAYRKNRRDMHKRTGKGEFKLNIRDYDARIDKYREVMI